MLIANVVRFAEKRSRLAINKNYFVEMTEAQKKKLQIRKIFVESKIEVYQKELKAIVVVLNQKSKK